MFNVDNTLWSHSDNEKSNFSVLREEPTEGFNNSIGDKNINFSKANTE